MLHSPSAEMQQDKTVMIGGGFLNENLTPPRFNYNTYNYYLNVTIFPCLEIAYTCTLFKVNSSMGSGNLKWESSLIRIGISRFG